MFTTNTQDPRSTASSADHSATTDTVRQATAAPAPYAQQQYQQQQHQQRLQQQPPPQQAIDDRQQQGSTLSSMMGTSSSSKPPPQQHQQLQQHQQPQQHQPQPQAEPYPPQATTWWEEAHSPHPGHAERGYGPGPSGGHTGGGGGAGGGGGQRGGPGAAGGGGMTGGPNYGHEQQQYGQYGGRTRDDKRARDNQSVVNWNKVAKIICSIFLPPLGVFLETGCDKNFAINVLLTILGYLPGIIHALYVIFTD